MHRIALLSALVLSGSALADNIYRWRDSAGVDHYTNDLNTIPTSATVVPTSGGDISEISTGAKDAQAKAPAKPSPQDSQDRKLQAELRRAEAEARIAEAQVKREEMQSEEQWRALFRASRARLSALEAEMERDRASGDQYSGLPVQGRYVSVGVRLQAYHPDPILESRVRRQELERELKMARDDYNDLERRASFAAVPRHWRQ
jgi:hypothetical protein